VKSRGSSRAIAHPLLKTLVAPFESNPAKRMRQVWFDRQDEIGTPHRVRMGSADHVIPGRVLVESYGDYFAEYARHPEAKAAGPDGDACKPWTTGVLQPRDIEATSLVRMGKETNRLAEDPVLIDDPEDLAVEYPEPCAAAAVGHFTGRQRQWCKDACRKREERRAAAPKAMRRPIPSGSAF
jgi:hypothetical protein